MISGTVESCMFPHVVIALSNRRVGSSRVGRWRRIRGIGVVDRGNRIWFGIRFMCRIGMDWRHATRFGRWVGAFRRLGNSHGVLSFLWTVSHPV